MKGIGELTKPQVKEKAIMYLNQTGYVQDEIVYFVQLDDKFAVGSDGSIYKVLSAPDYGKMVKQDLHDDFALLYKGTRQFYYFEEDMPEFDEASKELAHFEKCRRLAVELSEEY